MKCFQFSKGNFLLRGRVFVKKQHLGKRLLYKGVSLAAWSEHDLENVISGTVRDH